MVTPKVQECFAEKTMNQFHKNREEDKQQVWNPLPLVIGILLAIIFCELFLSDQLAAASQWLSANGQYIFHSLIGIGIMFGGTWLNNKSAQDAQSSSAAWSGMHVWFSLGVLYISIMVLLPFLSTEILESLDRSFRQ